MMKYLSYIFCVLLLLGLVLSCKKDSGPEPVRELQEQAPKDDEALVSYLQTHFYNYEEFDEDPDNYKIEISIDTIADDNTDKTLRPKMPLIMRIFNLSPKARKEKGEAEGPPKKTAGKWMTILKIDNSNRNDQQ